MAPETDPRTELAEMRLAGNVRTARLARAVSQTELARQMAARGHRWHQQTVAKVERGQRAVRMGEAEDIAAILGTTIETLSLPTAEQAIVEGLTEASIRARQAWTAHAETTIAVRAALSDLRDRIREARTLNGTGPVDDAISLGEQTLLMGEQLTGGTSDTTMAREPARDGAH